MKVEVEIEGVRHEAQAEQGRVKVPTGRCRCCSDLDAALDPESGRVLALAATPQGMQKALREFPGARPQPSHEAGPLYVNSPDNREVGDREIRGRAFCCRCRRETGEIIVHPGTVFGLAEDRAVRERCRAY